MEILINCKLKIAQMKNVKKGILNVENADNLNWTEKWAESMKLFDFQSSPTGNASTSFLMKETRISVTDDPFRLS